MAVGPVRNLGDERGAGGHLDRHVGAGDDEVADVELARGVQRQPVEARDVRDRLHALDAPVVRIGLGGRRPEVDAPRGQLRLDAALDEDLDAAAAAGCLRALSRSRSLMTTRVGFVAGRLGELVDGGGVGVLDRQRQERGAVTRGERLFEARDQLLDRVGRRRRLSRGPCDTRERARHASARRRRRAMGGHILDPSGARWGA